MTAFGKPTGAKTVISNAESSSQKTSSVIKPDSMAPDRGHIKTNHKESKMKLNKSLLIVALSFFADSGLVAKEQSKKDEVPGVAAQPASYFYTGKPYDADLGAYTFNFRNYDPELKRWTSVDPSGFPDGANNNVYAPTPTSGLDAFGLSEVQTRTLIYNGSYQYDFSQKQELFYTYTVSYGQNQTGSISLSANTQNVGAVITG